MTRRIAGDAIPPSPSPLAAMNLEGLRLEWRRLYGEPPALRSTAMLRRLIAWRLDASDNPGAVEALRAALNPSMQKPSPQNAARGQLHPGDRVSREWLGVRHEADVLEDGRVAYKGSIYVSLSAVAREITGTRWNGPRFFGLRSQQ